MKRLLSLLLLISAINLVAAIASSKQIRHRKDLNDLTRDNENFNSTLGQEVKSCQCMEYWNCAARHGEPYAYCGISETEVCCFLKEPTPAATNFTANVHATLNVSGTAAPPAAKAKVLLETAGRQECGKQKVDANLDSVAQFLEWPWHVAILENEDDLYICGGSLISPNRVLTAAHCVSSYLRESPRLKVRVGEYDVSTNGEALPHTEVMVSMVAIHPEFNNSTLDNDIAIIGLSKSVKYADNVLPVCLPPNQDSPKPVSASRIRRCVVTGWGRRREDAPHSIILKEIIVPVWESHDCQKKLKKNFGPEFVLPPGSFCAGDERRDACDGDGGGPLVCYSDGRWVQEGVVSFGVGCGRRETPGIYTKVSWFGSWIEAFMLNGLSTK